MELGSSEVTICHLHRIIQPPKGGAKAVAKSRESTARSSVRLEHDHWLPCLLCDVGHVYVWAGELLRSGVLEESREDFLCRATGSNTELCKTVVGRIAFNDVRF